MRCPSITCRETERKYSPCGLHNETYLEPNSQLQCLPNMYWVFIFSLTEDLFHGVQCGGEMEKQEGNDVTTDFLGRLTSPCCLLDSSVVSSSSPFRKATALLNFLSDMCTCNFPQRV